MTHKVIEGNTCDLDQEGRVTHARWQSGTEYWFDAVGNITHTKRPDGTECWYYADGKITRKKLPDGTDDLHTN